MNAAKVAFFVSQGINLQHYIFLFYGYNSQYTNDKNQVNYVNCKLQRNFWALLVAALMIAGCGGSGGGAETPVEQSLTVSIDGPDSVSEDDGFTLQANINKSGTDVVVHWYDSGRSLISEEATLNIEPFDVTEDTSAVYKLYVAHNGQEVEIEHTIEVKHRINVEKKPKDAAKTVLLIQNLLLEEAQTFSNQLLAKLDGEDIELDKVCENGGLYTLSYLDNDDSSTITGGDILQQSFQDCSDNYRNALSGLRVVTILDADLQNGIIEFSVNNDDIKTLESTYSYNELMTFKGSYSTRFAYSPSTRTIAIAVNEKLKGKALKPFSYDETFYYVNIKELTIEKVIDFDTATYSIKTNGTVDDTNLNGEFSFSQEDAWYGYFMEYPHKGSIKVSSEKESILLASNFVSDSDKLNISYGEEQLQLHWSTFLPEAMSTFNMYNNIRAFRADNFDRVLDPGSVNNNSVQLDGPVPLIFSRAVAADTSASVHFQTQSGYDYINIPGRVEVAGALINIYPEQPLKADTDYDLQVSGITSVTGQEHDWIFLDIKTTDSIIPNLTSSNYFYQDNQYPTLSIEDSILNKGQALSYQWVDLNGVGIEFDDENAVSTSFSLPEGIKSDITVEVILTNDLGDLAKERITLQYLPYSGTYLFIDGIKDDYVSLGKKIIKTQEKGNFSVSRDSNNQSHLEFTFESDESSWSLNLKAPGDASLSVGEYLNATRYPFQGESSAGLDLSGEHRGCGRLYGQFEIFELEENAKNEIQKLAVNIKQSCESSESPELKGYIRFNSAVPLNP